MVTTLWIQTVFNHIKIVSHISNPNSAETLQKVVYNEFENVLRHFPRKKELLIQTLFCRTLIMEHFHIKTSIKFNWENLYFIYALTSPYLKKMNLFSRIGHLEKIILKGRGFWGGSDEKMRRMWFGLEIDVVGLPPLIPFIISIFRFSIYPTLLIYPLLYSFYIRFLPSFIIPNPNPLSIFQFILGFSKIYFFSFF